MDDNKIFFRKQGIRTTIIVNKMLVLIKMISLVFFFLLLNLSITVVVVPAPGDIRMVGISFTQATKTCFLWNLNSCSCFSCAS